MTETKKVDPFDIPANKTCDRCDSELNGAWCSRFHMDDGEAIADEIICPDCDFKENIEQYRETGIIKPKLITQAVLFNPSKSSNPYIQYWGDLLAIRKVTDQVSALGREFELRHWFGLTNEDNIKKYMAYYAIFNVLDKIDLILSDPALRSFLPPHAQEIIEDQEVRKKSIEIINPRPLKPLPQSLTQLLSEKEPALKEYYKAASMRGHSAQLDGFKMLLWGSAGRVMLTIEDEKAQVSWVFDESSENPRGGLQSYEGTEAQVIGLLKKAIKSKPVFVSSEDVSYCGF